jgi:hypothetical protein
MIFEGIFGMNSLRKQIRKIQVIDTNMPQFKYYYEGNR